jgi:PAS domain S-box-containing protein
MAAEREPSGAADRSILTASPQDIEQACHALQDLKHQLVQIARMGGGVPSSGLLMAAADNCADAVIIANDQAEIVMVNGAAARLTGCSTRELQTLTVWDITHAASQVDFDVLWREFLRAGRQRGGFVLMHRSGAAIEVAYCAEANVLPSRHVSVLRKGKLHGAGNGS